MKCTLCVRHQRRPKRCAIGKAVWVDVPCVWLSREAVVKHGKSDCHKEAAMFEANRLRPAQTVEAAIETQGSLSLQARIAAFRSLYWLMKRELPHTTNYKPLLDLCAEQGVNVISNLNNGANDNGESQRFIQEAVLTMGRMIQEPVLATLRQSPWYSLMIDETTDIAVIKEMVVYARYLKDGVSQTEFISMVELSDGRAETIVSVLLELLQQKNLPLQKLCSLGSDGASVMVGKTNGVGARLRQHIPHLISNHCVAHRLALAVGQAAQGIAYLKSFKDILGQLHRFYKYSAVRMDALHQIQELYQNKTIKLCQAKDVRWLSHDQATTALRKCFKSVLTSLEREAQERSDVQAMGLSVFLQKYKFVASLMMMSDVLPHMSALSKAMQRRDAVYTTVKPLVQGTISIMRQLQTDPGEHFRSTRTTVEALIQEGFNFKPPTEDEEDQFMKDVYKRFIQNIITNLEERFPDLPLIQNFGVFDMSDVAEDELDNHGTNEIMELADHFRFERNMTREEWRQIKASIYDKKLSADLCMEWVVANLEESHPAMYKIAAVGLLLPTSTADCERGFSTLNRLKTTHRNKLSNKVLNSLLTVSMQGPDLENFHFEDAVRAWYQEKPRRSII